MRQSEFSSVLPPTRSNSTLLSVELSFTYSDVPTRRYMTVRSSAW